MYKYMVSLEEFAGPKGFVLDRLDPDISSEDLAGVPRVQFWTAWTPTNPHNILPDARVTQLAPKGEPKTVISRLLAPRLQHTGKKATPKTFILR